MAAEELVTFLSKDGTKIACWRSGNGPPLVLVHGTTADHTRWTPLLPAFGGQFTVYAMDRRGRGASGDTEPYALEREFEDVAAVVSGIDDRVNLLGHSYGALCSLEASLRARNLRRLILYEPPTSTGIEMYPKGAREALEALLATGDREALMTAFFREVVRMPDSEIQLLRSLPAWKMRLAAAHTIPREFADAEYKLDPKRFRSMTVPTLLLQGSESPSFLKSAVEAVLEALPKARKVVLQGQAHVAMDTGRELFVREVTRFLA